MRQRFLCSNKEYCQLVYESVGIWVERAAYATDNSRYYLYYKQENISRLKQYWKVLKQKLEKKEGAIAAFYEEAGCIVLYFDSGRRRK